LFHLNLEPPNLRVNERNSTVQNFSAVTKLFSATRFPVSRNHGHGYFALQLCME